jgi:N-acyl-L-homoserine lactone synthetase
MPWASLLRSGHGSSLPCVSQRLPAWVRSMSAEATAPGIVIKLAETAEEREQAFRLRYETYVEEINLLTSIADHSTRRLADAYDEHSTLLLAEADGQPVGTMRLTFGVDGPFSAEFLQTYAMDAFFPVVAREEMAVVTRFTVREAHRGTVTPFQLIVEAARIALKRNVELVFCDCQPHLMSQWSGLGFRPYRHTINDPVFGLAIPLVMLLNDGDYLRQIGSPLIGTALDSDLPTSEAARRVQSMLPSKPPVRSLKHLKKYDWPSEIAAEDMEQALRVFDGLRESQLAEILSHSHIIDVALDAYLIRQGQTTRTMYVLLGGELQYWFGQRRLANAQVGEVVGDVAFFLKTSRTIDVIAGPSGARVLSLNEPALRRVMEAHSPGAAILLFNLCRMLAERVADRTEGP